MQKTHLFASNIEAYTRTANTHKKVERNQKKNAHLTKQAMSQLLKNIFFEDIICMQKYVMSKFKS